MLCRRCMTVMGAGTRYEQGKDQRNPSYKRYFECSKCHERVYTDAPNFQEIIVNESRKSRNK